jgi:hypothetical protein
MPASLVELEVAQGLPVFRCPVTGIPVWTDEGFDESADHSPYIRFFIDWADEIWVVSPSNLEGDDATKQRELVASLRLSYQADEEVSQDDLMKQLAASLPSSAAIFEILNPMNPDGCGGGDICYIGFDFGSAWRSDNKSLHLELIDEEN